MKSFSQDVFEFRKVRMIGNLNGIVSGFGRPWCMRLKSIGYLFSHMEERVASDEDGLG